MYSAVGACSAERMRNEEGVMVKGGMMRMRMRMGRSERDKGTNLMILCKVKRGSMSSGKWEVGRVIKMPDRDREV